MASMINTAMDLDKNTMRRLAELADFLVTKMATHAPADPFTQQNFQDKINPPKAANYLTY